MTVKVCAAGFLHMHVAPAGARPATDTTTCVGFNQVVNTSLQVTGGTSVTISLHVTFHRALLGLLV